MGSRYEFMELADSAGFVEARNLAEAKDKIKERLASQEDNNSETPTESSTVVPKLTARLESSAGKGYYIVFTTDEQVARVKLSIAEFEDLLDLGLEVDAPREVW